MAQYTDSGVKSFTSGEALNMNRRVKFNSSRQVVYADADDVGIGITRGDTACTSGDPVSVALWSKEGTFKVVVDGAVTANDILYGTDDGCFDDDPSYGRGCMMALETATADDDVIEAVYIGPKQTGLIYSATADSDDVENTTTETAFSNASKTIDGSTLQVGDVIEVIGQVLCTDSNSTDTLNVKLYVGTEEIVATGAVDASDDDILQIHAFITIRSTGASGTLAATGTFSPLAAAGSCTTEAFSKSQATEDISGDVAIAMKATWSVAHADNECECENFVIIIHRQ